VTVEPSTQIGVISDTHGRLRAEAIIALEGCDVIFHAGDVCDPSIVAQLNQIAPCHAVAGNCDDDESLPATCLRIFAGLRILVHHGHLPVDEAAFRPDVVITGHTHVPKIEQVGEVLRLNPGSAGPRRFNLPVTVARITLRQGRASARLIPLDVP
jgi:putative phosphoesterase